MNSTRRRHEPRFYLYFSFVAVCLAGLMPASTIISSSHSLRSQPKPAAERTADASHEAELFYPHKDRDFGKNRERSNGIGHIYQSNLPASLRDLTQLALQDPAAKIAPQVLTETAGGSIASVGILLADQADVSAAADMKDQDARGWFVFNTLTQHAARTQVGLQ